MRFKSGLCYKVEHLKTYETDLPREDVIYRLSEQDGTCRNQDSNGFMLEFKCYENGDFFVKDPGGFDRQIFLQGRVESENGKTIVPVETVKNKSDFVFSVARSVICFLVAVIGCVFFFMHGGISGTGDMLKMLLLLILPVLSVSYDFREKNAIPVDVNIMLKEIDNRILGVVRWDK